MKKKLRIVDVLKESVINNVITIFGWVRTKRESKNVVFININDGSTLHNLQVILNPEIFGTEKIQVINTGTSISIKGLLKESKGQGQKVELVAEELKILGETKNYPLQPKKHSMEFLRELAHLRVRTNTFSAIYRIRHQLIYAIHTFFHQRGFLNVHTPILTSADCEGAGEMFQVTTLDLKNIPKQKDGNVDYSLDFFGKQASLAVSGQLEGELAALGLGNIYTFGPTFRAENSNTKRHLAEFWMVEPEMAFYNLEDNIALAEEILVFCLQHILTHCNDDLDFLEKRQIDEEKDKKAHERSQYPLRKKIKNIIDTPFVKITYTEAIDILKNSKANKKKKFQYLIQEWGVDLQSEHERYLVEKHFDAPVVIYNYPAKIKAFYMRLNDDDKTVAAMDVLFPSVGEIIGGSQREERHDYLLRRVKDMSIEIDSISWYLDTRKYGTVPHSGFGLGFERLMLFVTGINNIRDVIPFPRTPGHIEF